jgi:glycosyltransferase involved in cell wall biosynthesis
VSQSSGRPHVLLVSPGFAADENDTACLPALQLFVHAAAMAGAADFSVVSLHHPPQRGIYTWHGLVIRCAGGANRQGAARIAAVVRALGDGIAFHHRRPVDLVHGVWLTDAACVATRLGRLLRRPVILTAMGRDASGGTPWTRVLPLDEVTVTVPSRRAADSLRATTGRVADAIVPWGVEPAATPLASWADRDVDIIGVGALEPVKNWWLFLRVVAAVAARQGCRRAVLVGGGSCRQQLEAQIVALGLDGVAELTGELVRDEALDWIARSRVLLHTADSEALGLVLLEALAHGTTVVSRPVGIAEASDHCLIAADEPGLVAMTASALAAERTPTSFRPWTTEATARAYGALYRKVMADRGP